MDWLKYIRKAPSDFGLIYVLDQVLILFLVLQYYELKIIYIPKSKNHFIKSDFYHATILNLQKK